jgi:hypothetical protein
VAMALIGGPDSDGEAMEVEAALAYSRAGLSLAGTVSVVVTNSSTFEGNVTLSLDISTDAGNAVVRLPPPHSNNAFRWRSTS